MSSLDVLHRVKFEGTNIATFTFASRRVKMVFELPFSEEISIEELNKMCSGESVEVICVDKKITITNNDVFFQAGGFCVNFPFQMCKFAFEAFRSWRKNSDVLPDVVRIAEPEMIMMANNLIISWRHPQLRDKLVRHWNNVVIEGIAKEAWNDLLKGIRTTVHFSYNSEPLAFVSNGIDVIFVEKHRVRDGKIIGGMGMRFPLKAVKVIAK
jgi:hypothetical protein